VEPVAEILPALVAHDGGVAGELEVDAVAVAADSVAAHGESARREEVDPVPRGGLAPALPFDQVAGDHAVGGARRVDPEEGADQPVVGHDAAAHPVEADPGPVL